MTGLAGVSAIAAGRFHSLAVDANGTVWAWGSNGAGQLGDGTTTNRSTPQQVPGLGGVRAVAGGQGHSLGLKHDGTVWAWGSNGAGQLGDGTTTDRPRPVQVAGLSDVNAIAAGWNHSLAVKTNGTVWAWGANSSGRLGDGTTIGRQTPGQVMGLTGVSAVAAGFSHSLALKNDGTLWAWGGNSEGQLGDGTTTNRLLPVQVTGLGGVSAIAAGGHHSLAIIGGAGGPTQTHTATPTSTATATVTGSKTVTATPTATGSPTPTPTATATGTGTGASNLGGRGFRLIVFGPQPDDPLERTSVQMDWSPGSGQTGYLVLRITTAGSATFVDFHPLSPLTTGFVETIDLAHPSDPLSFVLNPAFACYVLVVLSPGGTDLSDLLCVFNRSSGSIFLPPPVFFGVQLNQSSTATLTWRREAEAGIGRMYVLRPLGSDSIRLDGSVTRFRHEMPSRFTCYSLETNTLFGLETRIAHSNMLCGLQGVTTLSDPAASARRG